MIQRGAVHQISGSATPFVILTRDDWNDRMSSVGGVPILASGSAPEHLRVTLAGLEGAADITRLQAIPIERIDSPIHVLSDDELLAVERALADIIDAPRFAAEPLRSRRPLPGAINYPRAGEVYYLTGAKIGNETKRYLVASRDDWNRVRDTVLIVRTTTQPKFPVADFPIIQSGAAQAACGELTAVPADALDLSSRPATNKTIGMSDLREVIRGICATYVLRDYPI